MIAGPRPAQLAAYMLLAALPLGMAVANRSAPALLVGAALVSAADRARSGEFALVLAALRRILSTRLALACLAFLGWALLSMLWGHHLALSAKALGELALAALAPLVLAASLPRTIPRPVISVAALMMAAGCLWVFVELATGLSARAALGFRSESFIFKRSTTAMLVVFWPLCLLLWGAGLRALAAGLGTALAAAVLWAHAGAAALGFVAGLVCLGIARMSALAASRATLVGLLAALLLAPVTGELASRALPDPVLDRLHDMQGRDRILIWQSFGEVVRLRPGGGTGFGTSAALGSDPVAAEAPADRRHMLAVGHPHNGYLQIWTETGLVGAALAGLAFVLLLRAAARLGGSRAAASLAVIACAGTIMLVAHGAWQGWWIATLGAAALWTVRLPGVGEASLQLSGSAEPRPRNPVAST